MDKRDKMFGREVSNLDLILRNLALEGIIFEMREVFKGYMDRDRIEGCYTGPAEQILDKYNKSWDELYTQIDEKNNSRPN